MTVTDKDILAFITQMPPDMKQSAVRGLEFLRGVTIAEYKAKQIEAAEILIADVKQNPDSYQENSLYEKFKELIGGFEIPGELDYQIALVKHFIGYRGIKIQHTDGTLETRDGLTFDDYAKDVEVMAVFNQDYNKKRKRR